MNATKNTVNKNEKVIKEDNKVCAILHTITSFVWMLVVVMKVYGIVNYGDKAGFSFYTAIGMVILFGCLAISYFCKYRKEKENGGK